MIAMPLEGITTLDSLYRWRRWTPKGTTARLRRRERRRRRAYCEAERIAGRHGMRFVGEAGPEELIDSWSLRDSPPWTGEET